MGLVLKVVLTILALLGLVSGRVLVTESIVSKWPSDMAIKIGQEGRMNFTLKPGKQFTLLYMKAVFVGEAVLETFYAATPRNAIVQPGFTEHFETIEGSQHDLKIKSMIWTGAGTYQAGVTDPTPAVEERQFTVVAIDQAKCSVSKTDDVEVGDVVSMDCSAEYTGYKAPMMKWKDANGREIPGSVVPTDDGDGTTPSLTAPKKVVYRANITASTEHDGHTFTCSLFFEDPITYTDSCSISFGVKYDKILPIPPIAGIEGVTLNISCEATIPSEFEGVRLGKLLKSGSIAIIVQLLPPNFDQPPADTAKYQLTKTSLHGFYITIKDVVFEDAARYKCSLVVNDAIRQLTTVVIVRKPSVHVMDQIPAGQTTQITCDADYQVPFDLSESTEMEKFPQISAAIGEIELPGGHIVRTLGRIQRSWNVTLEVADDQKELVCKVYTASPVYEQTTTKVLSVIGEDFGNDTIVSQWPTDMAVRVGKEGRINFRLLPGKRFKLLTLKANFVGTDNLLTIYQATESSAVVQPDFEDVVEKIPDSPHDLVARQVPWSGAGYYQALVMHMDLEVEQRIFKMVVINQVQCSLSKSEDIKEGDVVSMTCSAEYTGDTAPMMKWQNENGKDIQGFVVNTPDYSNDKTSLTTVKKVVYRANVTVSCDCPRRLFKCRLSFEDPITYTDSCNTWFGVQ